MFPKLKHDSRFNSIVDFIPPQRHDGVHSYIWFSQIDPLTGKLKRKKYALDRFKPGRQRDTMANRIIANIYSQVAKGWNVWVDGDAMRTNVSVDDVLQRYRDYHKALERRGAMKHKTMVDYLSRLNVLCEYLADLRHIRVCAQLDQAFFTDFLDWLITDRDLSARSRNNYRTWCSTLCSWMVQKKFLTENPIQFIHQLKEGEKLRDAIPQEGLARMREYLKDNKQHFLLACMMEYYTFIRPEELRHIKVGHLSVVNQEVIVPADVAKTGKERHVGICKKLMHMLIDLDIFSAPSQYYLFSDGFKPGKDMLYVNAIRLEWNEMRKALRWPANYQFYSLKDSGIRDLANAEGVVTARDQAGHSDVAVTNKYLKRGREIPQSVKDFDGAL